MNDDLGQILSDSQSGSAEIADHLIDCLLEAEDLEAVCAEALANKGDMACVQNLVAYARRGGDLLAYRERERAATGKIGVFVDSVIESGDVIFTHSRSSQVVAGLKGSQKAFEVIVSESAPMMEGRGVADELGATCVLDAAMMSHLPRCSRVVVGADAIFDDCFVNKMGTYLLLLGARELCKPVYVIAGTSKRLDGMGREPSDAVFEMIPLHLVNFFIDELGVHQNSPLQFSAA